MKAPLFWAFLLLTLTTPNLGRGTDFFTTNVNALPHFWAAIQARQRPVTVLSFGDSMADSYRSATYHVMNRLNNQFGNAGYSLNNYRNTAGQQITNTAYYIQPDNMWFIRYQAVPPEGATWWINLLTPGGNYCDRAGIFYVAHPQGGLWRLMLSTNDGPWSTVLTVDGYSAYPTGRLAAVDLPLGRYRLRAETDSGTNFIIGPYTVNRQTNGIHAVFLDWPGISLSQVTNVPPAIRDPIFAAVKPDLLIWHMKEETTLATSNRMEICEAWWKNSIPDCDIIYIGTPWVSQDIGPSPQTTNQNLIVRNIAIRHGRCYADLMQPTVSYDWLATNSFMADVTHLNSAGGLYCANIMWNDLGFYALGLDRRINLQRIGAQLQLSYNTFTNARYRLEISTDLHTWSPFLTNPIANAVFATNFTSGNGPAFYRLRLTLP
jgi:hypothetical protein